MNMNDDWSCRNSVDKKKKKKREKYQYYQNNPTKSQTGLFKIYLPHLQLLVLYLAHDVLVSFLNFDYGVFFLRNGNVGSW